MISKVRIVLYSKPGGNSFKIETQNMFGFTPITKKNCEENIKTNFITVACKNYA